MICNVMMQCESKVSKHKWVIWLSISSYNTWDIE